MLSLSSSLMWPFNSSVPVGRCVAHAAQGCVALVIQAAVRRLHEGESQNLNEQPANPDQAFMLQMQLLLNKYCGSRRQAATPLYFAGKPTHHGKSSQR